MPNGSDAAEVADCDVAPADSERVRRGRGERRLVALSGTLAAGLAVLAVLVLAAQVWGWVAGHPGPKPGMLIGHLGGAGGAVVAQRVADRRTGRRAVLGAAVVLALVAAVLVVFWWF